MEIRQLEYFLAVRQSGSFTRAAERLYVSQPAVTNAIRGLEEELGIQLFDRGQKLAVLTAEGRIFATHVEQVMHGITNTIEEINAMKNLSGGVLNLGLTSFGGLRDCAEYIKKFRSQYPEIKFHLVEDDSAALCRELIEDKIDLAVLSEKPESNVISCQPLPRQEMVVCASRHHRFRRQNTVALHELTAEPLILLTAKCAYRQCIIRFFEEQDSLPQIVFESGHVQTMKSLAAAGCGIAILPESLCDSDDELSLSALEPPLYLEPVLAWKTNHHLSHAANAFLTCIQAMAGGADHE